MELYGVTICCIFILYFYFFYFVEFVKSQSTSFVRKNASMPFCSDAPRHVLWMTKLLAEFSFLGELIL